MLKIKAMPVVFIVSSLIVLAVLILIPALFIKDLLELRPDTFYWLFATIAQSMAALFAVVGMFAVFRYQIVGNRLGDLRTSIKKKFATRDWVFNFGITDSDSWADNLVEYEAGKAYERPGLKLPPAIDTYLRTCLVLMKMMRKEQEHVLRNAKFPLASFLITFIVSIGCLPLTSLLADNLMGVIIADVIIALAAFSMIVTFWYLARAISTGRPSEEISTPSDSESGKGSR